MESVWLQFVNGNDKAVVNKVSPAIYRSWNRCREQQVDHQRIINSDILALSQFKELVHANEDLVRVSKIVLQYMLNFLHGSDYLILVTDKDGVILESIGDPVFLDKVQKISIKLGSNWREDKKGTNVIGTVLIEQVPMAICGWEHYVKPVHFVNCWGAPIRHPNKSIAGVLNISSSSVCKSDQLLALAVMGAGMIEHNLRIIEFERKFYLSRQNKKIAEEMITDGLAAFNSNGFIAGLSKAGAEMLGYKSKDIEGEHILDVFPGRGLATFCQWESTESGIEGKQEGSPWVGRSPKTRSVLKLAAKAAKTDSIVFIQGESGTGKENIARIIHQISPRRDKPFIAVNCAAIPDTLIESELFGYAEGAFSGARRGGQAGKFELAHEGTIFLDEVGDMPLSVQSVLLRVLQTCEVCRIGEGGTRNVNVRVIAATNQDCSEMVKQGQFRLDLYYRLKVINIQIPPLRERIEDIYDLVPFFLRNFHRNFNKRKVNISEGIYRQFLSYSWPGNVRQLENCIESMVALADGPLITEEDLPDELKVLDLQRMETQGGLLTQSTEEAERNTIIHALEQSKWNVTWAARLLGIGRTTLHRKIHKYNIVRSI
ncbi:MAG: sigma-54-dependent Fis family transcriptional regulator [Firmicutes bacterium]|nr:sigma-54-dependent Fis family transcriptional regulator [Bacillota bacterium]